jgi:hypothetical protein
MSEQMQGTLANLKEIVPGYDESQGYEIVGLLWNQGLSDMDNPEHRTEYEVNLANLIKDLRYASGVCEMLLQSHAQTDDGRYLIHDAGVCGTVAC